MRFAEHMLLGAMQYKLVPYTRDDNRGGRCALGLVADGDDDSQAERIYPWLLTTTVSLPCKCQMPVYGGSAQPYHIPSSGPAAMVIVHIFNEHVARGIPGPYGWFGGRGNPDAEPWTLERLADWVESIDPTREVKHEEAAVEQGKTCEGDRSGTHRICQADQACAEQAEKAA